MNESQETQPKPEAGLPLGAARGYVLRVPAEYVESFEALLDLACEAAESTGTAEMWSDNERETVKAIQERKWVAGHNGRSEPQRENEHEKR